MSYESPLPLWAWERVDELSTECDRLARELAEDRARLTQVEAERDRAERRGIYRAAELLDEWRYDMPGREAEWCRHLAGRLREAADAPAARSSRRGTP